MLSLYFISLYQCLDKVQCNILQNSTLVQRVARQGMVLFYTYVCFDTYSKLSRYEVSTSLVPYSYIFMKKKRMMTMPETFSLPFINLLVGSNYYFQLSRVMQK